MNSGEKEGGEELTAALASAVSGLVSTSTSMQDPATPPPSPAVEQSQPEFSSQLQNHFLSKSGSADSAVEATEELLEDLESKVCSDDEKENVNVCLEEKNNTSNCDISGDKEKKSETTVCKGEDSSDRRNLAEIKI